VLIGMLIRWLRQRTPRRTLGNRSMAGIVVILLVYLLVHAWHPALRPPPPPPGAATAIPESRPAPVQRGASPAPPPWLTIALCGLLGIVLGIAIARVWRKERPAPAPLAVLAQDAIASIEAGADLKNVVLRCYADMSELLAEQQGAHRLQTMTAREFEHALAVTGLDDAHIHRLTRLFEAVRYGAAAPGAPEEREAIACLSAIVAVYGRPS